VRLVDLGKGVEVGEEGIMSRAKESKQTRNGKEFVRYNAVEGVVNHLKLVRTTDNLFHMVEGGVSEKFVTLVHYPLFGDNSSAHILEEDVITMDLNSLRGA
jgi:hypothetical protein